MLYKVRIRSMGTHTSYLNVHTMHSTGTSKHVLVRSTHVVGRCVVVVDCETSNVNVCNMFNNAS